MESGSYVCEEGLEYDVIDLATDPLSISRHPSFGWESRNPSRFNESTQLNKITNNLELKFPDKYRKKVPHNPICDILDGKVGDLPSSNAFLGEDETSKLSGSVVDSNNKEFPLSDLKLGRFADPREAYSSKLSSEIVQFSESVSPQKRARVSKLNLQIAFCQVHGCNKDLSSSKGYHKKHKVCQSHTKTAKVIVNGIEQRFCQQCSRFHLIAEFDDAKRSCRRRLTVHNERRRKPQVGLPSRPGPRYLQSYDVGLAGNMNPRTTSTGTSLIFQETGYSHSGKVYGMNDWFRPREVEDNNSFSSSTITPTNNRRWNSKPRFGSYGIGAQNQDHTFDIGGFYKSQWSSLPHDSSASEVFDAESMVHDLPRISNSGCAHSLLSSFQPRDSSCHFSGLSMCFREASTVADQSQTASPMLACENNGNNFQINQGILRWPEFQNVKDRFSRERNPTIGLLQLSSQLQRPVGQKATFSATSGLA